MKLNRLTVLVTILIVVSVGTNIFAFQQNDWKVMPTELVYKFPAMFDDSAIIYRPEGSQGFSFIDMNKAVIVVTEFGAPMNCAVVNIVTAEGIIRGHCVEGELDD